MTEAERKIKQRCRQQDLTDLRKFEREEKWELVEAIKKHLEQEHAINA